MKVQRQTTRYARIAHQPRSATLHWMSRLELRWLERRRFSNRHEAPTVAPLVHTHVQLRGGQQ